MNAVKLLFVRLHQPHSLHRILDTGFVVPVICYSADQLGIGLDVKYLMEIFRLYLVALRIEWIWEGLA
jgi:hypothetical protein